MSEEKDFNDLGIKLMTNLNSLLDSAEKRINDKEERRKLEEERKQQLIKKTTEEKAYAIIKLIFSVLKDADQEKGEITSVDKELGELSTGTESTEKSHYSVSKDSICIYLNYSNEYYDRDTYGHGKCFLNEGNVDFCYLKKLLDKYGIDISRYVTHYSRTASEEIETVTITTNRVYQKNINESKGQTKKMVQ